ncbi:MAG: CHAT domain-containing protein [Saprospiraceae bacterium]|nr:CHAT domain-containing protein [Saprospiraceae bacterium]
MTASDVRNLIAGGKIEQAIKELLAHLQHNGDNDLYNAILTQSSRFQDNERQNRLGMVSSSDYTRTRNAVTYALLESLEEVFGKGTDSPPPPNPKPPLQENNRDADTTTILFMTSNPSGTAELQLEKEHSRISSRLQDSPNYSKFRIRTKKAVTLSEFQESIFLEKPNIIHFSGHGDKNNNDVRSMLSRGLEVDETHIPQDNTGIMLYDENKRDPLFVGTNVIQRIFRTMVKRQEVPIKAVVFNSCYSDAQAKALSEIVPYVVGTSWSIKDEAAIAFATGFYFGIAQGEDVEDACDMGINQAIGYGEPEDRFVLYKDGQRVEWH